jgi:hypothetical protein
MKTKIAYKIMGLDKYSGVGQTVFKTRKEALKVMQCLISMRARGLEIIEIEVSE